MNTFGRHFRVTSFGESHGPAMGVVIDGCPAGAAFSLSALQEQLERRRPGRFEWQTSRNEPDKAQVLSGVFKGKTLGAPIAVIVMNKDARSKDYEKIKKQARAGHADDLWKDKFGHSDYRGGGRASGRETVSRVIAGAVALMFLKMKAKKYQILGFSSQIGPYDLGNFLNKPEGKKNLESFWKNPKKLENHPCSFPDKKKAEEIKQLLVSAKKKGESFGGKAVMRIRGVPKGLGQPVFGKLKSDLAGALMGVGGVCGVTAGRDLVSKKGSRFHQDQKNYGGIRGGISTGEEIELEVLFKPPSSLGETALKGRHDPCIIPRAIPVLEAMIHLVIADHLLAHSLDRL